MFIVGRAGFVGYLFQFFQPPKQSKAFSFFSKRTFIDFFFSLVIVVKTVPESMGLHILHEGRHIWVAPDLWVETTRLAHWIHAHHTYFCDNFPIMIRLFGANF